MCIRDRLGLQWQWHANPSEAWGFPVGGVGAFRLFSVLLPEKFKNYWDVPNLLLQKFPASEFQATVKLTFKPYHIGEKVGLIVIGDTLAYLSLTNTASGIVVSQTTNYNAIKGGAEVETPATPVSGSVFYLRVSVVTEAMCRFSYSLDGTNFTKIGDLFKASPGRWIGAKVGLFCTRTNVTNNSGFADLDWFRIEKGE